LRLAAEKGELERQKAKLSPVQDFVQVSKIGRQLIDLEKKVKEAAMERERGLQQPLVAYTLKYGHSAAILGLCVVFWGTPLLQLPLGWFFPIGRVLCISGGDRGHLGILPYAWMCSSLIDKLLRSAALAVGLLKPPPAEQGFLGQITGALGLGGSPMSSPMAGAD
jgi:hypothetical protein